MNNHNDVNIYSDNLNLKNDYGDKNIKEIVVNSMLRSNFSPSNLKNQGILSMAMFIHSTITTTTKTKENFADPIFGLT
ncbi:hypothetical protein DERP_011358 [Dermatophagoides pteronyssinus]|uniref:Uncharacterized protein n=1 Tax=Dermatophagoides pteronyssinus TaxID=6956 RepID=A0ABQ8J804_DERPT|nr:hypothetical protein DERP_011358 [Dermatophagoides pteronyssinus]